MKRGVGGGCLVPFWLGCGVVLQTLRVYVSFQVYQGTLFSLSFHSQLDSAFGFWGLWLWASRQRKQRGLRERGEDRDSGEAKSEKRSCRGLGEV